MPETLATPTSIHDTVVTPEPSSVEETLEQKVERLEAALAAARQGNLKAPIETTNGQKTYKEVNSEHAAYMLEMALVLENSRRFSAEHEAKNPISYADGNGGIQYRSQYQAAERPLLDLNSAVSLFGLREWKELTPALQAKALTATPSDVKKLDVSQYFGKNSSSRKAAELKKDNPAVYKLLKKRALDENVF